MVVTVAVTIGHGTMTAVIVQVEETETIVESPGGMRGGMITTDLHGEKGTYLKVVWIAIGALVVVVGLQEAIETSLRCKWEVGKKAQALRPRRRNLHLI